MVRKKRKKGMQKEGKKDAESVVLSNRKQKMQKKNAKIQKEMRKEEIKK